MLVLLHPLGADRHVWAPVTERLAAEREVIAFDLPGFGESAPLNGGGPPTPAALAEAVAASLPPGGPHHVAGNSLGGWVALELAAAGHARSVTAIAPAGLWPEPLAPKRGVARGLARAARPLLPALVRSPAGRRLALAGTVRNPSRVPPEDALRLVRAYADAPGFEAVNRAMRAGRFTRLEHIRVPVTLGWPEHDHLVRRPAHLPPNVRSVALPGAGHVPMWDAPDAVAAAAAARLPPPARQQAAWLGAWPPARQQAAWLGAWLSSGPRARGHRHRSRVRRPRSRHRARGPRRRRPRPRGARPRRRPRVVGPRRRRGDRARRRVRARRLRGPARTRRPLRPRARRHRHELLRARAAGCAVHGRRAAGRGPRGGAGGARERRSLRGRSVGGRAPTSRRPRPRPCSRASRSPPRSARTGSARRCSSMPLRSIRCRATGSPAATSGSRRRWPSGWATGCGWASRSARWTSSTRPT